MDRALPRLAALLTLASMAAASGAPPEVLQDYPGFRLAGRTDSSAELTRRGVEARREAHLVPRAPGPARQVGFEEPVAGSLVLVALPGARRVDQLLRAGKERSPDAPPGLVHVDQRGARVLFRVTSRSPLAAAAGWVYQAGSHRLHVPPIAGRPAATVQARLDPRGYLGGLLYWRSAPGHGTVVHYRALDLAHDPGRGTSSGRPPVAHLGVARRYPRIPVFPAPELVRVEPGGAWIQVGARPALHFLDPETSASRVLQPSALQIPGGSTRFMVQGDTRWWAFRNPPGPARLPPPTERDPDPARVAWHLEAYEASYQAPPGARVHDLAHGGRTVTVSLALPASPASTAPALPGRVLVLDAADGSELATWDTPAPRRIHQLTRHLLLQDTDSGVTLLAAPQAPETPPVPRTPAASEPAAQPEPPSPTPRDRPPRRAPPRDWNPPVSPTTLLIGLACGVLVMIQRGARSLSEPIDGEGITVTPSRPAGETPSRPEPPDAGPDEDPGDDGVVILPAPEDEPPPPLPAAAPELLTTFLLLRAADALRGAGELESGAFEALRGAARARILPLWEETFPGQAGAFRAWVKARAAPLAEHLPEAAREPFRARLASTPEPDSPAPRGGLAQLAKLHCLYVEVHEALRRVGTSDEVLGELRGRIFEQALSVVHELRREGLLGGALAGEAGAQVEDLLAALAGEDQLDPAARRALVARVHEDIGRYLALPEVLCRVCGDPLGELARVRCQDCETPHHHDCWEFAGGCAVFACGGRVASHDRD